MIEQSDIILTTACPTSRKQMLSQYQKGKTSLNSHKILFRIQSLLSPLSYLVCMIWCMTMNFIHTHVMVLWKYFAVCCTKCWFILGVHLHELLEGSDVHLPEPVVSPRVNAIVFL